MSDVDQLIDRAYDLPDSAEKVAVLEEAIRLLDGQGDELRAYHIRMELVEAATWCGMPDRALVAFSWCLAWVDRQDEAPDLWNLLWRYKWILGSLPSFSSVSREQIFAMEDDLARRFDNAGFNGRAPEKLRCGNRRSMGDLAAASEHYQLWQSFPRDIMADCAACEMSSEAEHFLALGENETALSHAMPLINREKPGCKSVPHRTYEPATIALLRLGRVDEAAELYPRAMRLISGKSDHIGDIPAQLLYLVRAGELTKAIRQIDRHLPLAAACVRDTSRREFYRATALALEALAAKSNRKRKLKLPEQHPLRRDDHTYQPAELAQWFADESARLSAAFDVRNGNDYFAQGDAATRELVGL